MTGGGEAEILVVCTGNIARSPLAEALLRREAARRGIEVGIRSGGVHGLVGHGAVREMTAEAVARGLDLSDHRAAAVTAGDVEGADLVVTMTRSQRDALTRLAPSAAPRTFTLGELARLARHVEPPAGGAPPRDRLREVTRRADSARAHPGLPGGAADDVADPYGGSRGGYRRCAAAIERLVAEVAPLLFGEATLG